MSEIFNQAVQLFQQDEGEKAAVLCKEILEVDSQHAEAMHLLGMIYAKQQKMPAAIAWFEQAVAVDERNAICYNHLANAQKSAGQWQAAEENYQRALQIDTGYATAYHNLGILYYQQERFDEALTAYAKAVRLEPGDPKIHHHLGNLLLKKGEPDAAKIEFNNVLQLQPNVLDAHYQLANLALLEEDLDTAEQHFQRVLLQNAEHVDTLNNLGVVALKREQAQLAIDYFTKALAIDNDHTGARNNIAATFLQHERYENALRHYHELVKLTPNDIEIHFNMGVAHMALGHFAEAIAHYEKVLSIVPEHLNSLRNLGAIYLRQKKQKTAREIFQKILKLAPGDAAVEYMLAAIEEKKISTAAPEEYVASLFDYYAPNYEKHLAETLHYQVPQAIAQALAATQLEGAVSTVVDLGCGTGLCAKILKPYAKTLIGVDLSKKMLAQAKEKQCYDELVQADLLTFLADKTAQYHLLCAADVFGYLGDLESIFLACQQALTEQGLLVFSVEQLSKGNFALQSSGRYAYTEKYIARLIKSHSFNCISQQSIIGRTQDDIAVSMWIYLVSSIPKIP